MRGFLGSIRTKLIVFSLAGILVSAGVPLFLAVEQYENWYQQFVTQQLNSMTTNMSEDAVPLLIDSDSNIDITTFLLGLERYDNVVFAHLYDADHRLYAQFYNPTLQASEVAQLSRRWSNINAITLGTFVDGDYLVSHKLIGDERLPLGNLLIVNDYQGPLNASISSLSTSIRSYLIASLLMIVIAVYWLQRSTLNPLINLWQFTRKVYASKNYGLRTDVKGRDEVAQLSGSINTLLETIDREITRNQQANQQLQAQQDSMERLANYDVLTGLPNRLFFMELLQIQLKQSQRAQRDLSVMFFDLDGFKQINDVHGHEIGDKLLVAVARRVEKFLRDGDILSRLGGDEFLILLPNNPDKVTLIGIAERLIQALRTPFVVDDWELSISASVGITHATQAEYSLSSMISNADLAMYAAKGKGKNCYALFDAQMEQETVRRIMIANAIESSLELGEFEVHYQMKVNAQQQPIGFEALTRWIHPDMDFISPAEFIPIAERAGKITKITRWMLVRVMHDLPQLIAKIGDHCIVSVNMTTFDLRQKNTAEYVKTLLAQSGIAPNHLEIEVTESAYLDNFAAANAFFTTMQDLGVSIALDDFGTGYSSLSYLTQIHINTLKIDKQFVDLLGKSARGETVTKTIIKLAHQLDLKVCAEGVEYPQQMDFLVKLGCDQIQGYLYSKPCRLSEVQLQVDKLTAPAESP